MEFSYLISYRRILNIKAKLLVLFLPLRLFFFKQVDILKEMREGEEIILNVLLK